MTDSDRRPVAVSELAQLARCEQQMLLDRQYGQQRPTDRERAAQAGKVEHADHDRLARRYQGQDQRQTRDRRCFVATAVYGENAWQTETLREWRDRVLQPSSSGRVLIRVYYHLSPPLARWLTYHPAAGWMVRRILDKVAESLAGGGKGRR